MACKLDGRSQPKKIDFAMFDRVYAGENVGSHLGLLVDCFTEVQGIGGNSR